jgi:pyruvate formate-lyase/glycerol dehydratase family glycyl radical enzyme
VAVSTQTRATDSATGTTDAVNALTERVETLKREAQQATAYVSSQASHSFTTSWQETEGQPTDLRYAKAYERIMNDSPVVIRDGELVVGSMTKYIRGSNMFTAHDPRRIFDKLESRSLKRIRSDRSAAEVEPEEERILKEDLLFWDKYLPAENFVTTELRREFGEEYFDLLNNRAMVLGNEPPVRELRIGEGTFSLAVLRDGLNSVIARATVEMEKARSPHLPHVTAEGYRKIILLRSMIIACEAVIGFSKRHAELASKMAGEESDPTRKKELQNIAERCEWVPENPPRSFADALQSLQFLLIACRKEPRVFGAPPIGRLDQYLYPYYEKDLAEGKITRQEAAEMLGCMFVKLNEIEAIIVAPSEMGDLVAGGATLPHITIGGRTKEGRDATNELSYLILEVARRLHYAEPAIYVRYHDGMKGDFLMKALEVNRDLGGGNPSFMNDSLGTARLLARGVDLDHAVDWSAEGCLGYQVPQAYVDFVPAIGGGEINLAKIFELTLNDGFDTRTGKQLGLHTGDATRFTDMAQFYDAFETQLAHFVGIERRAYYIKYNSIAMQQGNPPFSSIMIENCITDGLGPYEAGSARYPELVTCMVADRGCTDVADSLAAIKKLVFDQKKFTMADISEALKTNWAGREDVYQACLKAPKYGNDDDYVDEIFNYISLKVQEIILSVPDPFTGGKCRLMRAAGVGHVALGMPVGALPNGRRARTALNDAALSAMPGVDTKGPTALINSATKVDHAWEEFGIVLNMKFSRQMLGTPDKLSQVLSLLKTFFDRGGWVTQFNIHSPDELIDARIQPEKHRDLVVRIAGYNAYFVDLPPMVQDEIIGRTVQEV